MKSKKNVVVRKKDYRTLSFEQVVDWVIKNCQYDDVRIRIQSRSVAWILFTKLKEATNYINTLESTIKELKGEKDATTK